MLGSPLKLYKICPRYPYLIFILSKHSSTLFFKVAVFFFTCGHSYPVYCLLFSIHSLMLLPFLFQCVPLIKAFSKHTWFSHAISNPIGSIGYGINDCYSRCICKNNVGLSRKQALWHRLFRTKNFAAHLVQNNLMYCKDSRYYVRKICCAIL